MDVRVGLEESWVPKNWCFWTVVLKKTLESPLDCKIQPVHPKGDQSWVFSGRTDAKAETPILWQPHSKSWPIGKDPDPGRDWGQEEKGMTKDEMAGWHHRLNGHESEWTAGVGDGQGGLECCSSWGCKEWDTTERLNWTELKRVQLLQKEILETFSKSLPSSNSLESLAEQLADQLSVLDPRRWLQSITHSIGSGTIMLIIILVIIFVIFPCLSTKIVQTKQTQLVRAFFTKVSTVLTNYEKIKKSKLSGDVQL